MRYPPHHPSVRFAVALVLLLPALTAAPVRALPPQSTPLSALSVSATTGEKPQSKVWSYAGKWWCVLPNSSGTWVWRLDGSNWTSVYQLSTATGTHADCKAVGGVTHVLLFNGGGSELASIQYDATSGSYQAWAARPGRVALGLDSGTETATIDLDGQGRMWLVTDRANGVDQVVAYYSDAPYGTWNGPVTLATGINGDDIALVTAMPGRIGVMWSNQNTQRFGFRTHVDGADPATWTADEVPASQSALSVGGGMADDHLHVTVASDGTLYAAAKTSYDTSGYPKIALLVRRPGGTWDDLYPVDQAGTRAIVLLDEAAATVTVVYTSVEGAGNILYKESPTGSISFAGASTQLMPGGLNDATSTKANVSGSIVILAGSGSAVNGMLLSGGPTGMAGWWKLDGDIQDASGSGNHGSAVNSPSYVPGVDGQALSLDGTSQYATVPDAAGLRMTTAITIAAWIQPAVEGTQNLVSKSTNGGIGGYELCLASPTSTWPHKIFFRLNQVPSGDAYRINSTTLYSDHLNQWMHVAATYDGATMKLYVNGVLESSLAAALAVNANTLPLGLGAEVNASGVGSRFFHGALDDVRLYDHALTAPEIASLAQASPPHQPPAQPTLVAPADQATGVAVPPTLDVIASDPDSPQLTVRFYGRALTGTPGPDFSVVVLPDAQNYTAQVGTASNAMFRAQTQWCVSQRAARNLRDVVQIGDAVNGAGNAIEWLRADSVLALLEDPLTTPPPDGIPFAVCVGNHEQSPAGTPDGPTSTATFNQYFGAARFQGRAYYGGHFADNNDTWYQLFSASGLDFIVVSLEYDDSQDANRLAWADSLLKVHATRRAIVASHSLIGTGNPGSWSTQGLAIYNALKNNPNLFLMLCGHVGGEGRRQDVFDARTVTTLLADYQSRSNGGDGWLRLLEFSPANDVIRVRTYSPWLNQWEADSDSSSQFTIPYAMGGAAPFQLLGTVTNVPSGGHATLAWPGLSAGTSYEWYVTVSDGTDSTTAAATWRFTTAAGTSPPDAVTNLAVAPPASGNGPGGTTRLALSWSPPAQPGTASVYRKAFGDYPRYRAGVGATPGAPASPAAAEAAGWTLTAITAPGQLDTPPARDFWHYVVFTTGEGGPSAVSNRAAALDYRLGDVHDGLAACQGNNQVLTEDVSYLGGHYGTSVGADPDLACLDVGPTTDGQATSRPTPDGLIEFEDLVVFALDYGTSVAAPMLAARPAPRALETPLAGAFEPSVPALPAPGGTFVVSIRAAGRSDLQAASLELAFDRAALEWLGVGPGEAAGTALALSPRPGRVDLAALGRGSGLPARGELIRVTFRVRVAADPGLALSLLDARDGANRRLPTHDELPGVAPSRTELRAAAPNPFSNRATLGFALAQAGPVEISIFSVDGRRVRTLVRGFRAAGEYRVPWDAAGDRGERLGPGVYFVRLSAGAVQMTRRVVLLGS